MRKIVLFFGILILILSCKKMDHYEIAGKVYNVPDSIILILGKVTYNVGTMIQTDTIISGRFRFSGTLTDGPTEMTIMAKDMQHFSGYIKIWVDHCKITITGSNNYLSTWNVRSKEPEQRIMNLLQRNTLDQIKTKDSLWLVMISVRDQETQSSIKKKIDSISNEIFNIDFNLLKKHFNSLTAIEELYTIAKFSSIDKNEIKDVLNRMDSKYQKTIYGQGVQAELNKPIPLKIGDKMTDLDLHDLNGKQFKISDFSGKYILLDFWSLACYPCVMAAPELREINETYKNDLTIVGISMDVNPKMWEEATKRDSITWNNLSDGKGSYAGASSLYGISGMPTYILINPRDTIVERWEGFSSGIFKEKLNKYIDQKYK
jgi:peroxiredoxin